MEHLQAQLRELRSKQKRTLTQAAEIAGIEIKWLCSLESRYPRSSSLPSMDRLAEAYGVSKEEITALFSAEYRMRGYAVKDTLPEVARGFFKDGNFVVLDLETTGANPHGKDTEIVDIAIVDEDGIPLVSTLIKPALSIPEEVTAIHGITDEMVKDAPTFQEMYPQIVQALAGKDIVIYNADYDSYLLDNLIIRSGLDLPRFENWCLMRAYADYKKRPGAYGNYKWIKLQEACELEKVVLTDAHRALGDTLATYGLLKALAGKGQP
jgi:DNA polymerase III epsilon subunit-like protein